ncbi:lysophospholipid acyltransferase family protein [Panacagrimonas sp.]|uniref:lysophospholipid acyltransferase family protein n=1 Tax=Panacagrimonas sp. TaxID=2480088 RepID=UPI003B528AFC
MWVPLLQRLYGVFAAPVLGLIVFGVVCPLILLAPTLSLRRRIGRGGVRLGLLSIGIPLRVRGLQHLPAGACLAVANHASYMDGLVLTAALPERYTFVVQDGAGRWPYVGLVLRRMGCSFVNRSSARDGAAQTRQLIRRVQEGESLAVFAEGTFEPDPGLLPFKKGAFLIAARAGVPVVPVGIRGTRDFFGGHRRGLRWSRIEVEVGPPIAASTDAAALRDAARSAVLLRCGEPDRHAAPEPNGDLL